VDTDNQGPQKVTGLTGVVTQGPFGTGSKSEREGIYLKTDEGGRFVLRRKRGPTFGDTSLDKYVGKRVRCDGFVHGYTLLAERIKVEK
jgi:hypothetical protein